MAAEHERERVRERLQILWLRQLRYERLRVDVDAHLSLSGRQVHVQAALEALLDEVGIGRHNSEGRVLLGDEVDAAVLSLGALPFGELLLVEQVLGRRIVGFVVVWQRELWRWQMLHVPSTPSRQFLRRIKLEKKNGNYFNVEQKFFFLVQKFYA